jgi:hypothetical protein
MNCPKCNYPNPQGSLYCQLCYETLMHDAAKKYRQEVHRERRKRQEDFDTTEGPTLKEALHQSVKSIDWGLIRLQLREILTQNFPALLMGGCLVVLGVAILTYHLPLTRLRLYGVRFGYRLNPVVSRYLVGIHTDAQVWTVKGDTLDLPVNGSLTEETASLTMQPLHPARGRYSLAVQPHEWIESDHSGSAWHLKKISLQHPSLAPRTITLNRRGMVIERGGGKSVRLGRCLPFLCPTWPKGSYRPGDHWEESVEWIERLADWKIYWRGWLHWKLEDYQPCFGETCASLAYRASLVPTLWETPAWAQGITRSVHFTGTGHGHVLFGTEERRLLSNTYAEEGTVIVTISDLRRVPLPNRVGRSRLRKHLPLQLRRPEPGAILIQLHNKLDLRKI